MNPKLVRDRFIRYGDIESINLIHNPKRPDPNNPKKRHAYAFIKYKNPESAARAMENEDGAHWLNQILKVQYCQSPEMKKRRSKERHSVFTTPISPLSHSSYNKQFTTFPAHSQNPGSLSIYKPINTHSYAQPSNNQLHIQHSRSLDADNFSQASILHYPQSPSTSIPRVTNKHHSLDSHYESMRFFNSRTPSVRRPESYSSGPSIRPILHQVPSTPSVFTDTSLPQTVSYSTNTPHHIQEPDHSHQVPSLVGQSQMISYHQKSTVPAPSSPSKNMMTNIPPHYWSQVDPSVYQSMFQAPTSNSTVSGQRPYISSHPSSATHRSPELMTNRITPSYPSAHTSQNSSIDSQISPYVTQSLDHLDLSVNSPSSASTSSSSSSPTQVSLPYTSSNVMIPHPSLIRIPGLTRVSPSNSHPSNHSLPNPPHPRSKSSDS